MPRALPEWVATHDDQKVPARVRQRVFDAHGGICHISGRKIAPGEPWDLDHAVALILGGKHVESNLRPALKEFHKAKTATEMKVKAKTDAVRKKHIGAVKPKGTLKSAGFPKYEKQHAIDKSALKPLARRSLFEKVDA